MKKSLLMFAFATVVAFASTACGSASEDQPADNAAASQDDLVEGEEVLSRVREDVQGGDPQLTGVVSWDMIAIRKDGREYYVFGGYDGYGKTPEHTRIEVVIEKSDDGVRFTPRTVDGGAATLTDAQRKSIYADIEDILEDAPASALAIITNPKTQACKKGSLSIPVKILLNAVHVVSGLGCATALFVPIVGVPSCVAFASSMILHERLAAKAGAKCE